MKYRPEGTGIFLGVLISIPLWVIALLIVWKIT